MSNNANSSGTAGGKPVQLSPHFSSDEFACTHCGQFQVDMRLVTALEELRARVGKPLKISSGYRCKEHNAEAGGATASQHQFGRAADVVCPKGVSLVDFYNEAVNILAFAKGGIGLYPDERTPFLHLDVRGSRARWARVGGVYVGIEQGLSFVNSKGAKA